ncbi:hypothetical protein VTO73DRAFT_12970 [Trametes versicolor]
MAGKKGQKASPTGLRNRQPEPMLAHKRNQSTVYMRRNALSSTSATTPPPLRNHGGICAFWNQPGTLLLPCRSTRSLSSPLICPSQDAGSHSSYLPANTGVQTSTRMMEGETLAAHIQGAPYHGRSTGSSAMGAINEHLRALWIPFLTGIVQGRLLAHAAG